MLPSLLSCHPSSKLPLLLFPLKVDTTVGVGDVLTLTFVEPTDRGGLPLGWVVPSSAVAAGLMWSPPLYNAAQGRWRDSRTLDLLIIEASEVRECIAASVAVQAPLAVRDAARLSLPSRATEELTNLNCQPGSAPGLYSFGYDGAAALGLGSAALATACQPPTLVARPEAIPAFVSEQIAKLAAGQRFSLALLQGGAAAFSWGSRVPLGIEDTVEEVLTPRALILSGSVKEIACGWEHALLLREDGKLEGFGHNIYGQLGLGDDVSGTAIREIASSMGPVRHIGAGALHSLALSREGGTLWGFGSNERGQLNIADPEQVLCLIASR